MVEFCKKYLASLVFAILLHVGVFFILYANSLENSENTKLYSKDTAISNIATVSMNSDYSPVKTLTETTILDTKKTSRDIDNSPEDYLGLRTKPINENNENAAIDSLKNSDLNGIRSIKSETISNQKLQEGNKKSNRDRSIKEIPDASLQYDLEDFEKDVGLLNTDIPIERVRPKINRDHDFIKSEIEETNSKISDAINEVKKRNQQKIDEIEKQNNKKYIHNDESNDLATSRRE